MLNAARGHPTQSKIPLIPAHSAWTRVNALVLQIQRRGPGPAAGIPTRGRAIERPSDRTIESLLRQCRQTAAPRFMQRRACAQSEVRLFYAFFRGSAAGLRLRVSGVTSTSVACVMNPASDVPRGLS